MRRLAVIAAGLALAAAAPPASAAPAAEDQYVETIPDASGPARPHGDAPVRLAPAARTALAAVPASGRAALRRLATDPKLGARPAARSHAQAEPAVPSIPSAAVSGGHSGWLIAGLLLIAIAFGLGRADELRRARHTA